MHKDRLLMCGTRINFNQDGNPLREMINARSVRDGMDGVKLLIDEDDYDDDEWIERWEE